jgi:hypothetical protein
MYCIVVLTRGYKDINEYNTLIKRNISISNNLNDKKIPNLIFHEGNITNEQQIYIKNKTSELNLIFIDISNTAFKKEKEQIIIEDAKSFTIGYRHMCSFWFIDFLNIVNYDKVLRIDEDCIIQSNIDNIFLENNYIFITGKYEKDEDFVTRGLNEFSMKCLNKDTPKPPGGPYTNIICFSIEKIKKNELFQKYKNEVEQSNMIYKRRWGDLPLWGEVIHYIFGNETLKIDTSIKYYHGSHNIFIN